MTSHETRVNENSSKAAAHQPFGEHCVSLFAPNHKFIIQPRLTINQPNDMYEQEADKVADQVMRMESPFIQTKPLAVSSVQRLCAECEEEEKMQRKESNGEETTANNNLENYVGNLNNSGQSLSGDVRNFYEPRFGYDFSNVKVHTDFIAAKSAQSINALAYTSGNNIVFNNGQYSPGTDSGKRLLGHELTHVVQQGSGNNIISPFIQRREVCDANGVCSSEPDEEKSPNMFTPGDGGMSNPEDGGMSIPEEDAGTNDTSYPILSTQEGVGETGPESSHEESSWFEEAADKVSSWWAGEETPEGEPGQDIGEVNVVCDTEAAIGYGGGKNINLHGKTVSNYNHGKPVPAPFPSTVTVTTRKVKISKTQTQDQFDAKGTFNVTFKAIPSITLPAVPSGLTPCKQKAVQDFINGPLSAHEQDHANAFTSNYDGTFTATVDVTNIVDTPTNRDRAMNNPVNGEDQKRTATANAASKNLDPWTRTIPGLDC